MAGSGYPDTTITNSTGYSISGEVIYAVCSNSSYGPLSPNGPPWSEFRGGCLITEITANVAVGSQSIPAIPYTSSGTSYSQFVVIGLGNNKFQVTRITDKMQDVPPSDHVEPQGALKK